MAGLSRMTPVLVVQREDGNRVDAELMHTPVCGRSRCRAAETRSHTLNTWPGCEATECDVHPRSLFTYGHCGHSGTVKCYF